MKTHVAKNPERGRVVLESYTVLPVPSTAASVNAATIGDTLPPACASTNPASTRQAETNAGVRRWKDDEDASLLGMATGAYGDAGDPQREQWFTRGACAELLIDAGAVVAPSVCDDFAFRELRSECIPLAQNFFKSANVSFPD